MVYIGCQSGFLQIYSVSSKEVKLIKECRTMTDIRAICLLSDGQTMCCGQSFGRVDFVDTVSEQ
jgi:hypothetical protein